MTELTKNEITERYISNTIRVLLISQAIFVFVVFLLNINNQIEKPFINIIEIVIKNLFNFLEKDAIILAFVSFDVLLLSNTRTNSLKKLFKNNSRLALTVVKIQTLIISLFICIAYNPLENSFKNMLDYVLLLSLIICFVVYCYNKHKLKKQ